MDDKTAKFRDKIKHSDILELVCDECKKLINKGTRVGCSCVFISKTIAGTKIMCPECLFKDSLCKYNPEAHITSNELWKIRNEFYDSLPTGTIKTFELLKLIEEHIKKLDKLISSKAEFCLTRTQTEQLIKGNTRKTHGYDVPLEENIKDFLRNHFGLKKGK